VYNLTIFPIFVSRCNLCNAQYPTQAALQQHESVVHKMTSPGPAELAIPVINMSDTAAVSKLAALGIRHYIPLPNAAPGNGTYSIPIVSAEAAIKNPSTFNLQAIGASALLNMGPLRMLPPR